MVRYRVQIINRPWGRVESLTTQEIAKVKEKILSGEFKEYFAEKNIDFEEVKLDRAAFKETDVIYFELHTSKKLTTIIEYLLKIPIDEVTLRDYVEKKQLYVIIIKEPGFGGRGEIYSFDEKIKDEKITAELIEKFKLEERGW